MKKKTVLEFLPNAKLVVKKANKNEIEEGWLFLDKEKWHIKEGILCAPSFSDVVKKEQKAIKEIDDLPDLGGTAKVEDKDFFESLKHLPEENESRLFSRPGSFLNIALGASCYKKFLKNLKGKLKILELGADSGWSCAKLSEKGHQVIGLDINNHLKLRKFWQGRKIFFEAVKADMHKTPFKGESFDLVFAVAAAHHSSNIDLLASEVFRVLKPGGKFMFLREPMRGKFAKSDFALAQKDLGVSENLYAQKEWKGAFKKAGFVNLEFEPTFLDYEKFIPRLLLRIKIKFYLKKTKRDILRFLSFLRNFTICDYNFSGQKGKKRV